MSARPKIAFYWCASCGGCDEAVVDLAEELLPLLDAVDIAFWPVAMDFKRHDVEALADGALAVSFVNGAIRTSEQEEMAHLLRAKSRILVAYGACAQLGGIPGLANQFTREEIIRTVYQDAPTVENPAGIRPQPSANADVPAVPAFHAAVRPLHAVVPVDYSVPGCPPTPRMTAAAIRQLLGAAATTPVPQRASGGGHPMDSGLPPAGSVLAPDIALCEECPRRATKPETLSFAGFHRPHEVLIEPATCLLAQGLICLGPATRGGCGALCLAGNMPCTGCCGPTSRVRDQGAKMLSSLSANVTAREPDEITAAFDGIPDPVGTFYRYALPASLLHGRRDVGTASPSSVATTGGSRAEIPARAPADARADPKIEPRLGGSAPPVPVKGASVSPA